MYCIVILTMYKFTKLFCNGSTTLPVARYNTSALLPQCCTNISLILRILIRLCLCIAQIFVLSKDDVKMSSQVISNN